MALRPVPNLTLSEVGQQVLRFFDRNPHTLDYADSLARRLGRRTEEVERALADLSRQGLVRAVGGWNGMRVYRV
ncbi:MAG TPA: hypothetical protein EYP85_02790, partial [Armatimonadetes bacterium]|nr:hypothetical protein [Armatimonadota bacterium]